MSDTNNFILNLAQLIVLAIVTIYTYKAQALAKKTGTKVDEAEKAAITASKEVVRAAEEVKVRMDDTVKTIEETKETVKLTATKVDEVQKQTDGHLSAMERLLEDKTKALADEARKVERLMAALQEARGATGQPLRRDTDLPVQNTQSESPLEQPKKESPKRPPRANRGEPE